MLAHALDLATGLGLFFGGGVLWLPAPAALAMLEGQWQGTWCCYVDPGMPGCRGGGGGGGGRSQRGDATGIAFAAVLYLLAQLGTG